MAFVASLPLSVCYVELTRPVLGLRAICGGTGPRPTFSSCHTPEEQGQGRGQARSKSTGKHKLFVLGCWCCCKYAIHNGQCILCMYV